MYTQYTFINKTRPKKNPSHFYCRCVRDGCYLFARKIYSTRMNWYCTSQQVGYAVNSNDNVIMDFLGRQSGWPEISWRAFLSAHLWVAEFLLGCRRFALPDRAAPVLRPTIMASEPARLRCIFISSPLPTPASSHECVAFALSLASLDNKIIAPLSLLSSVSTDNSQSFMK